jgi:hypothetical protein
MNEGNFIKGEMEVVWWRKSELMELTFQFESGALFWTALGSWLIGCTPNPHSVPRSTANSASDHQTNTAVPKSGPISLPPPLLPLVQLQFRIIAVSRLNLLTSCEILMLGSEPLIPPSPCHQSSDSNSILRTRGINGVSSHWQDPDSSFILTLFRHVRWERSSPGSVGKTHCRRVSSENSGS